MKILNLFIFFVAILIVEVIAHQSDNDFYQRNHNSISKKYRRHDKYTKREKRSIHQQHQQMQQQQKNNSGIKRSNGSKKLYSTSIY